MFSTIFFNKRGSEGREHKYFDNDQSGESGRRCLQVRFKCRSEARQCFCSSQQYKCIVRREVAVKTCGMGG